MEQVKDVRQEIGELKHDTFRFGLQSVRGEILETHPVETAFHSVKLKQQQYRKKMLSSLYGTAMPLKMEWDQKVLSRRFQRPPGPIPSSFLGYEAVTGALDDIGVEDYLNDPADSENFRPADMHHGMEVRLGLSKGPVAGSFI
ncbi:OLC1v1009956C1 [Oldenlandia corymbosa var. corymbosa]|uniref:OLC1v1009956C1 n=1 Tax=Oldenlandia corymbosa var. corymbosa TaxID=529605 RepID=A0AAV1DSI9_OLDCO|nr:OLC1v1009956C1 [Oldenlandia corymbosa var. corymbosa]